MRRAAVVITCLALAGWQSNPGARHSDPGAWHSDQRDILGTCRSASAADQLARLAEVASGADRHLAVACSRAAVRITDDLDRDVVLAREIPDDELRAALGAWRALSADAGRWPDVRVHGMVVGRALRAALGPDAKPDDVSFDRPARFADPDPMIRRAALELTRSNDQTRAAIAAAIADPDPRVAIAAAQSLCGVLAFGEPAAPLLAAAGGAGLARIQTLVRDKTLSRAARVDARRCLTAKP